MEKQQPIQIECAHCGNQQLMQVPGTWTPMAMGEEGLMQGPAVPVVMLGCPKCGFLQMFSPNVVKPQPWPQQPEQQAEKK